MSAPINKPFGFRPVRNADGSPWCGQTRTYVVLAADTSDYRIGDLVMLGGSGDINGYASVIKYANGGSGATAPVGAIVGVLPIAPDNTSLQGSALNLESKTLTGSITTDRYVLVVDDPTVIYEAQADSVGLRRDHVGSNVDVTVTNPSETEQLSASVLVGTGGTGAPAATSTFPFKIIGFKKAQDNDLSSSGATDVPFVVALVRPNEHAFNIGTTGLAV